MDTTGNTFNMGKIKFWTITAIILVAGLVFFGFNDLLPSTKGDPVRYDVVKRWELPSELREISAIAWLATDKLAAIQDEDGIIYIYDLKMKKVIETIKFGSGGDFEGLAIVDDDAYVLESNGRISEISNFETPDRTVNQYDTGFSSDNDMETLAFDEAQNRLLIAPKDRDLDSDRTKGVYAFSLDTKTMNMKPVLSIDLGDKILKRFRENDLSETFRPSDLAIHPETKYIYVLEGAKPKLLILDADGNPKSAFSFDKRIFRQPEGITFSPDGRLFIASEGKKGDSGTITELKLR